MRTSGTGVGVGVGIEVGVLVGMMVGDGRGVAVGVMVGALVGSTGTRFGRLQARALRTSRKISGSNFFMKSTIPARG